MYSFTYDYIDLLAINCQFVDKKENNVSWISSEL